MAAGHPTALRLVLVVSILLGASVLVQAGWGYTGARAPSTWSVRYPICRKLSQTPINIVPSRYASTPRLCWSNYDLRPATMKIRNTGYTLIVSATYSDDSYKPQILLADNQEYQLAHVHFHWGKDNSDGSEHAIMDEKYPLEMHAVHKRVVDGVVEGDLLVVGVMFDISEEKNLGLKRFMRSVDRVTSANTSCGITPFRWSDLIPEVHWDFFTYQGSLTTPPCSEVVTWVIKREPEAVSQCQMDTLRTLKSSFGEQLAGNFRPLQSVNGRPVTYVS